MRESQPKGPAGGQETSPILAKEIFDFIKEIKSEVILKLPFQEHGARLRVLNKYISNDAHIEHGEPIPENTVLSEQSCRLFQEFKDWVKSHDN